MKRILSLSVLAALAVSALFFGCQPTGDIEIGVVFPLTGGAGKYGEDAKLGVELAVSEINGRGGIKGRQVKALFEDDQSSPQQALSAFNKLVSTDRVPAVIGGMTSSAALAIAPVAEQRKVVVLSPAASAPALSKAGEYFFRNELSDAYGGVAQAELTWKRLGIKGVGILYINNDYGIGVRDAFTNTYTQLGGVVTGTEAFEPDAQDFRTQLARLKQAGPDALFMVSYKEAIPILRQVRELGLKWQVLSTPVFEDKEVLDKAGKSAEGVIYVYYGGFDPTKVQGGGREFVDAYKAEFNREPGYYSALAYDAMNIMAAAIEQGGVSSTAVKTALHKIKDFPGITGSTTFDANGDVVKPVILKTVRNGQFVELK